MKPNLFIAIPTYGGSPTEFWQCLLKWQNAPVCDYSLSFMPGDSLVCRARNTLTAEFLRSACTHLLFIDSDLIWSGEQIQRMLAHDLDVVGGFYPKKKEGPIEWVCNVFGKQLDSQLSTLNSQLVPVSYIGTGFLLIKRAVFEQMIEKYGDLIAYHPDPKPDTLEYDFWSVGVYHGLVAATPSSQSQPNQNGTATVASQPPGRYLSEDWYFCQRWLDLGGTVWGDTRVILKHIGQAIYPLQTQQKELVTEAPDRRKFPLRIDRGEGQGEVSIPTSSIHEAYAGSAFDRSRHGVGCVCESCR